MHSTRLPLRALFAVLLLVVGFSCDDDGTSPPDESFSLEVRVQDADGSPIADAQVVVWNMSESLEAYLQDSFARRRARTAVRFDLSQRAVCDLTVFDLAGEVVQTVVERDTLEVGAHVVLLGPEIEFDAGVEVFRYELVARDEATDEELFRDERWMTAVHLDRSRLLIQRTGADGRWSTNDPTFVPGIFDLPELSAVDEAGEGMGSFTLGTSLVVRVYGVSGGFLQETIAVRDAANVVDFTWAEGRLSQDEPAEKDRADGGGTRVDVIGPVPSFRLYQNSPNPFN